MSGESGALEVSSQPGDGRVVVRVDGEVDLHTSPALREQLADIIGSSDGTVVLDLGGVNYMDSSGVGTLVYLKRDVEQRGRKFVLASVQARVKSVLQITLLDKFFQIYSSVDEAQSA
jgi:anti-sigma B factor antagonist